MKRNVFYLFVMLFCSYGLSAQIVEEMIAMSEGLHKAKVFHLDGADKGKAEKIWRDYMKEYGKVERDRKTKEHVLAGAVIPAIHDTMPLTIYASFDEYDELTKVSIWIKMEDRFINSTDDETESAAAEIMLQEYSIQVLKEVLRDDLKDEEKDLKRLERDLRRLIDRNYDLKKDIEKARETIRKAEAEIEENIVKQEEKSVEIEKQQQRVEVVSKKLNEVANQ